MKKLLVIILFASLVCCKHQKVTDFKKSKIDVIDVKKNIELTNGNKG